MSAQRLQHKYFNIITKELGYAYAYSEVDALWKLNWSKTEVKLLDRRKSNNKTTYKTQSLVSRSTKEWPTHQKPK